MLRHAVSIRPWSIVPSIFSALEEENSKKFLSRLNSLKTDIVENESSFTVTTEIPGLSKENISVKFENDTLTISTQVSEQKETKDGENVIHRERYSSNQSRSFRFDNIDAETINAKYENGILILNLNKKAKENSATINIE